MWDWFDSRDVKKFRIFITVMIVSIVALLYTLLYLLLKYTSFGTSTFEKEEERQITANEKTNGVVRRRNSLVKTRSLGGTIHYKHRTVNIGFEDADKSQEWSMDPNLKKNRHCSDSKIQQRVQLTPRFARHRTVSYPRKVPNETYLSQLTEVTPNSSPLSNHLDRNFRETDTLNGSYSSSYGQGMSVENLKQKIKSRIVRSFYRQNASDTGSNDEIAYYHGDSVFAETPNQELTDTSPPLETRHSEPSRPTLKYVKTRNIHQYRKIEKLKQCNAYCDDDKTFRKTAQIKKLNSWGGKNKAQNFKRARKAFIEPNGSRV